MHEADSDESAVVSACDSLARQLGYDVESYSDARKVRTCPGLSDRRYVKRGKRVWVEAKRPGGKMTEAQHRFLSSELDAGGMATVIDDPAQLLALFKLLGRSDGYARGEAVKYCASLVDLCARRGYRRT